MNYTKKQKKTADKYESLIKKILNGNPQRPIELMKNEEIKTIFGKYKLKYWLGRFNESGKIMKLPRENPEDKGKSQVRYRLYYLPKPKDEYLAEKRYKRDLGPLAELQYEPTEFIKKEEKYELPIALKIERTKKYQEKVLQPLFDWFNTEIMFKLQEIYINDYIEDYSCVKNESKRDNLLEYGPKYFRRGFDVWSSSLFDKRDRDLEKQFRDNHDLELFRMIDEFDKKYNEYWELYFDINERIRECITDITGLRIIDIGSTIQDVNEEKIDSVTTNLQFYIYNLLENYMPIPFIPKKYDFRTDRRYGECEDAPYEKYEFWYGIGRIECFLTEKEKGRSPEQFLEETEKKIQKIIMELQESKEVTDLYEKVRPLYLELEELEAIIHRRLKEHLDKDVLDGNWDYLSPAKK